MINFVWSSGDDHLRTSSPAAEQQRIGVHGICLEKSFRRYSRRTEASGARVAAGASANSSAADAPADEELPQPVEPWPRMQRRIKIAATGSYAPRRIVSSRDIDERLGKRSGWTERVFQISRRRYADEQETSSYMAACAALQALDRAGLQASELDAVVAACGVGEQPIPATVSSFRTGSALHQPKSPRSISMPPASAS